MQKNYLPEDQDNALRIVRTRRTEKKKRFLISAKPKEPNEWIFLADHFLDWCRKTDSIDIEEYAIENRYPPFKFLGWHSENDYFADALDLGTYMIGQRRLKAQTNRDKEIYRTMPLYDKCLAEYESSLKKGNHQEDQGQTINICDCQKWPSSDLVKIPKPKLASEPDL
jgi:hypothetical protein